MLGYEVILGQEPSICVVIDSEVLKQEVLRELSSKDISAVICAPNHLSIYGSVYAILGLELYLQKRMRDIDLLERCLML